MRKSIFLVLLLVACTGGADQVNNQIALSPTESGKPTSSPFPSDTQTPTNTYTPTAFPEPTSKPSETPIPETQVPIFNVFALNDVASQNRGGVILEIVRVVIGDREILDSHPSREDIVLSDLLMNKPVVGWLIFSITNNSGQSIHLHPRRGTVLINDEQIELRDYESYTAASDNFDGAYFSGEQAIGGGVWFGIENSEVDEITKMTIIMHGPHFIEKDEYGETYYFVLDLSNHVFEELPEYLR